MSTLIEDLFAEPVSPGSHRLQVSQAAEDSPRPFKRRRSSLFLEGSDDEQNDPVAPNIDPGEVDALFAEITSDDARERQATNGRTTPGAKSLSFDIEAYRREANQRARAAADASSPRAIHAARRCRSQTFGPIRYTNQAESGPIGRQAWYGKAHRPLQGVCVMQGCRKGTVAKTYFERYRR